MTSHKAKCRANVAFTQCYKEFGQKVQHDKNLEQSENYDKLFKKPKFTLVQKSEDEKFIDALTRVEGNRGLTQDHETIGHYLAKSHKLDLKKSLKSYYTESTQEAIEHTDTHKYSRLSNASYTYHANGDVHGELMDERYNYIDDLKDFKLDDKLSTKDDIVLHNPFTKETVVSYRGTVTTSDWVTNAKIAFTKNAGQNTNRFKNAENVLHKTMVKYGKENLKLVGHSQGGGISSHLGQKFDVESHSYNPAVSFKQILDNHKGKFKHNHAPHHIYRTDLDGVSINSHAPSIKKNFKINHINTVPKVDKNPLHVHGLGENFAPEVKQSLGDKMVKVTRNTKMTSITKGAQGLMAAAGIATTAYDTTMDITKDMKSGKSVAMKTKDVGVDVVKNVGELAVDSVAFDAAIVTAGVSVVATYYIDKVAQDVSESIKSFGEQKDYSEGYDCYGYGCK